VAKPVVLFTGVSLIIRTGEACDAVYPVTAPAGLQGAVHVKVVPATPEVNASVNPAPEQTGDGWVLVTDGVGVTEMDCDAGVPWHPWLLVGVTE
jgi:hypothetical protein